MSPKNLATVVGLLGLSLAAASCGGISNAGPTGEEVLITLATPATEKGMMNGTKWWAEEITKRTDGQVKFEIYYADALLPALDVLPGIRDGRVTAGWLSDAYWPTEFPLWQKAGIPFETDDPYAAARAYAQMYEENQNFRQEFNDAGVHVLHFIPYFPTMLGSRQPVDSLDDLDGQRLRSVGYLADALEQVGVEPAAMTTAEMYESIQRGVLDGYAGFPFDIVTEFGLQEVAPHTVDLGVGHYASTSIGISLDVWESLPDDVRDVMTDVSEDLQNERAIAELENLFDSVCDKYAEAGATLTVLPPTEIEKWKSAIGTTIYDKWKTDAAAQGVSEEAADEFYDGFNAAYEEALSSSTWTDPVQACIDRAS